MIRALTIAFALAAAPAWAAGPEVSIAGASIVGMPGFPEVSAALGSRCQATGRARVDVTFTDPDGVSYAAVSLRTSQVRPVATNQEEAWLWIPQYARPKRDYRWRYEDLGATKTRHTISMALDLVAGARPIPADIIAKDGRGAMTIRNVALVPAACR